MTFDPRTQQFGVVRHPEGRDIRLFVRHPEGLFVGASPPDDKATYRLEIYDGRTFRVFQAKAWIDRGDDLRTIRLDRSGNLWTGYIMGFGSYRQGMYQRVGKRRRRLHQWRLFQLYDAPSGAIYAEDAALFVRDGKSSTPGGKAWRLIHGGWTERAA